LIACLGTALLLISILAVLILDVGGWGTFTLDIARSLAVQIIGAVVLLGIVLAILESLDQASYFAPSRYVLSAIFVLAPVAVLPFLPIAFRRHFDVYDAIQTLALVAVFYGLAGIYWDDRWRRSSIPPLARPREPGLPLPPNPSVPFTLAPKPPDPTAPVEHVREDLYQNLLAKVMHDREIVERLIEYERRYTPNASREELLRGAIIRWERDNR
jgi:hypothetical protein